MKLVSYGKPEFRALGLGLVCVSLLASLITTAAVAAPPKKGGKTPAKPVGDIVNGKKVYASNGCANCHAINGTGGSGGPDLSITGLDAKHTAAWFKKAIVTPKAVHEDSTMPPYDQLKAKDLTDLCAYLGTLKKKTE